MGAGFCAPGLPMLFACPENDVLYSLIVREDCVNTLLASVVPAGQFILLGSRVSQYLFSIPPDDGVMLRCASHVKVPVPVSGVWKYDCGRSSWLPLRSSFWYPLP